MNKAIIFNIQKFSVNDGPGIRTTVFMKGCPLSCVWCHNPESKSGKTELFFDSRKCCFCGRCASLCPLGLHKIENGTHYYERAECIVCGKCADMCYTDAIELVGKEMSIDEIMNEVLKDKPFYENSGGGITLSGGEPMYQFDASYELLKKSKDNELHTCMETCGFAKEEQYKKIAPLLDIFLFDYKVTNPEKHKEFTGVDNKLILSNLNMLDSLGAKTILRCPIIPGLNDTNEHLSGIAQTANSLKNILEINIEPYHPLGKGKAEMLGKDYILNDLTFPEESTISEWIDFIANRTSVTVKKG